VSRPLAELLAEHGFFADLDDEFVAAVAACAREDVIPAGTVLFEEGGRADACWFVRRGRAAVEVRTPRGTTVIATVGPGQVLGWSWLFPPYRWHFDARALDELTTITLDAPCVRERVEADPRLGFELMRRFTELSIQRLQATRLQLLDLYGGEHALPERLER
jgi:CRP-like cAMP-binding protein